MKQSPLDDGVRDMAAVVDSFIFYETGVSCVLLRGRASMIYGNGIPHPHLPL